MNIIIARKPLEGNCIANVLKHGTGGICIDKCRVEHNGRRSPCKADGTVSRKKSNVYGEHKDSESFDINKGRFPANILLSPCVIKELDRQGEAMGMHSAGNNKKSFHKNEKAIYDGGWGSVNKNPDYYGDKGGASRFFYNIGDTSGG
jgi:hypothetical protein